MCVHVYRYQRIIRHMGWVTVFNAMHCQQYFNYILAVSFIGGGNRNTQRKPPTYRKSLKNFIT